MKYTQALKAVIFMCTLLLTLIFSAHAIAKPNELAKQIASLTEELEQKRIEHHIPGMAIAVVKNDQIIMAKGFGLMDLENNTPVKPDTMFSIGSSTKAITATMLGMLADQGKLDWDQKVTDQLPDYQFKVDGKILPMTYRDMLSHRTGYTRNDLLWANGQANRSFILETATKAEPIDQFRKNFYYNNVMYLAAGEAMAKVTGKTWDELLHELILNPLNMISTTSIHEKAIVNENISLGYQWNEETKTHDLMPRRNLNNIAPAGGIYSNVNDMAQWLRFQLNQGEIETQANTQQLISKDQLDQTHQAQIDIANGVGYGLGWMLRKWRNHDVIEHGGNIDGYGAQVAMLPDSNLGFVLLTNVTATPLQQASMSIVWEHLADQENLKTSGDSIEINYDEFVGEYHANFGPFKEAIFTFLIKEDGQPAVDVPGQTVYELLDPDETGKWYFKMTNTISISFDTTLNGEIAAMRMQQNNMNFELPRKGFDIEPEVSAETFDPFLGSYESKKLNGTIKAIIQNHRLTMDVPNQMAFELKLPDENGFREFRIKPNTGVRFVKNEVGEVTAVELYKNKTELVEQAPKIENTVVEALPTAEDIMKLRKTKQRIKALKKQDDFEVNGVINIKNSGIIGKIKKQFDAKSNFKQVMDFGIFGQVVTVINKKHGSTYGINPYTKLEGKFLIQAQNDSPLANIDWLNHYDEVKVLGRAEIDEKTTYKVLLKHQDLPATIAFVDAENGDVLKIKARVLVPSIGTIGLDIRFDDFRDQYGLRMPFKTNIKNPMMGDMEITYKEFIANKKFKKSVFDTKNPE